MDIEWSDWRELPGQAALLGYWYDAGSDSGWMSPALVSLRELACCGDEDARKALLERVKAAARVERGGAS